MSWNLQYQIPEDKNVISLQTLFQAYSSNAALADNTYANQYLNVSGKITNIRSNTYSNTVEVELGIPTELFYASFEFNASDNALYNLQVGNETTLTGFLKSGGSTYTLWFSNATVYQRGAENNGTKPASTSNDYPPTLPPIDPNDPNAGIYSDYSGLYVNKEGFALEIGMTSSPIGYYARIYENLEAARNFSAPLVELGGGEMYFGAGVDYAANIAFTDAYGEVTFTRMNAGQEGNYTFEMYADPSWNSTNINQYSQSTYYMVERYIDVVS